MTEKELKRLSRVELLELLLIQTRETERLRVKLETAKKELENRDIQIRKSGSLAEAVLVVNGVLDAANAAADQYLENMARMERETQARCRKMLENARAEAARILADAKAQKGTATNEFYTEGTQSDILEEDMHKSLSELMGEVRALIGEENE